MTKIQEIAAEWATLLVRATVAEMQLQNAVKQELYCHGSLRDIAKRLGFSAQYVCDVRKGRRKISKTFLEKIVRLK